MLDKALDKIKEIIDIEKFDNTKVFTDTDNKLPDDILLIFFLYYKKWL